MSERVAPKAAPETAALPGSAGRVMLEILIHGPLSRVELAERLGLSGPSLTRLTKPLLAGGRLFEGTPQVRSAGRPLQPLDLDPSAEHFAGVTVTADAVYSVVTDLRGTVRAEHEEPLPGRAPETVADVVACCVRALAGSFAPVAGVGISLGGNSADGRIVGESHFLEWNEVPLAELVEDRLGLPVVVVNDVNALTQAQHWFGAGRGLDTFAVVTVGAGIGLGLVASGRPCDRRPRRPRKHRTPASRVVRRRLLARASRVRECAAHDRRGREGGEPRIRCRRRLRRRAARSRTR